MQTLRPLRTSLQHAAWSSTLLRGQTIPPFRQSRLSLQDGVVKRTFISNPLASTQTISASRTISYPVRGVYDIISDVSSYSSFIPYCHSSKVTKTSSAAPATGLSYPEEAELVIGFNNNLSEAFWSRVYCVPHETIETVAGPQTETDLPPDLIRHHSQRPSFEQDPTRSGSILKHLRTTWTLSPFPFKPPGPGGISSPLERQATDDTSAREQTQVDLVIEYQFANPMYAALSQAAAPKVAEKVIEAFEQRVRSLMSRSRS